jgi:hypothetical protein
MKKRFLSNSPSSLFWLSTKKKRNEKKKKKQQLSPSQPLSVSVYKECRKTPLHLSLHLNENSKSLSSFLFVSILYWQHSG